MGIQRKITLLNASGLAILGLLSMAVTVYYGQQLKQEEIAYLRTVMLEERKAQLKDLIANGHAAVKSANFWTDGQRALANMRFGPEEKNYYFAFDRDGVFFVHPDRPDLVGEKHLDLKDASGKPFIREMIAIAAETGEGLIEYRWPKPGTDKPVRMLAAVKLHREWNWIICAGISLDDIDVAVARKEAELASTAAAHLSWQAAVLVVILVGVMLVSVLLSRRISASVGGAVETIHAVSLRVATASHHVRSASGSAANNAAEQAGMINQSVDSLNAVIEGIRRTVETTDGINIRLLQTGQVLEETDRSMTVLDRTMQEIAASSEKVAQVIDFINTLALKIRLVALNASVEAARAGAAGNSFAVIADAIRGMADHSAKAARDMGVLIDAAVHRVDSGVRQVADSRAKFAEVRHSVEEVNDLLRRIVASSDQQNREIEQIHKLNLAMEQATAHHTDLAAESAAAAESMSRHAEELNRVVADLVAVVGQGARDGNGSALPRGSAAAQGRMIGYTPLRQPT